MEILNGRQINLKYFKEIFYNLPFGKNQVTKSNPPSKFFWFTKKIKIKKQDKTHIICYLQSKFQFVKTTKKLF
ncbi:MAG: hypothetical protein C0430_04975 [Flavobacterium sp.]|nr:hypothetical protein [Flavobacterium sp.]